MLKLWRRQRGWFLSEHERLKIQLILRLQVSALEGNDVENFCDFLPQVLVCKEGEETLRVIAVFFPDSLVIASAIHANEKDSICL